MSTQAEQLQQTVAFFKMEGARTVKSRVTKGMAEKPAVRRSAATVGNLALSPSEPDLGSFAKF
jgi:hypothetical protein